MRRFVIVLWTMVSLIGCASMVVPTDGSTTDTVGDDSAPSDAGDEPDRTHGIIVDLAIVSGGPLQDATILSVNAIDLTGQPYRCDRVNGEATADGSFDHT